MFNTKNHFVSTHAIVVMQAISFQFMFLIVNHPINSGIKALFRRQVNNIMDNFQVLNMEK